MTDNNLFLREFTNQSKLLYKKTSMCGKIIIWLSIILLIVIVFKKMGNNLGGTINETHEGFQTQQTQIVEKTGLQVYDKFYVNNYDDLLYNQEKNKFEIEHIVKITKPTKNSVILDIGSGTGHHVCLMGEQMTVPQNNIMGIDSSKYMISQSKTNYPTCRFKQEDATNTDAFLPNTFTHITSFYFTIYYFKNKKQFFENCFKWLNRGGYLVIHLVNRDQFDPILPPGNPLIFFSPQKYASKRITTTQIKFKKYTYNADFKMSKDNKTNVKFIEKFKNDSDKKVRKNTHILYMEPQREILTIAKSCGFDIKAKVDMLHCSYENQYLYFLYKPN